MRVDTVFKFEYPFEIWLPSIVTDSLGNDSTVYKQFGTSVGLVLPSSGGLNLITTDALSIYSQVRGLKDPNGTSVFVESGTEFSMYVTASTPQFDPFGTIIGWKSTLRRNLPTTARDLVSALGG